MSAKMQDDEVLAVSPPEFGKKLGLGRNASYEAARAGAWPSLRIRGKILIPLRALDVMLDGAVDDWRSRRPKA